MNVGPDIISPKKTFILDDFKAFIDHKATREMLQHPNYYGDMPQNQIHPHNGSQPTNPGQHMPNNSREKQNRQKPLRQRSIQ